ncbi:MULTISPECIES: hypothetical protein [Calditerrivibrio]
MFPRASDGYVTLLLPNSA